MDEINSKFLKTVMDRYAPDANEEYFIYQTLTGVFPFGGIADEIFLKEWMNTLSNHYGKPKLTATGMILMKNMKRRLKILPGKYSDPEKGFLKSFLPFQEKISNYGIINSLSQLMLKAMSPGIPDFYQGTELWDLSMVDPDNRRPVDYALRYEMLKEIMETSKKIPEDFFKDLFKHRTDGRIKLWMTHVLLEERKPEPELFIHGKYIPLTVKGKITRPYSCLCKSHKNRWYIVIVPLFLAQLPDNK